VPERWQREDIREARGALRAEKGGWRWDGFIRVATQDEAKGYEAKLLGWIETSGDALKRFDVVARGEHWAPQVDLGENPVGRATLAVAFAVAEPGECARVPPLYTWDLPDYLRARELRLPELRGAAK
jgi:hypothetical protein